MALISLNYNQLILNKTIEQNYDQIETKEFELFYMIVKYVIVAFSIVLNFFLFYIIQKETDSTFKLYARILLQNAIIELIYTIVCTIIDSVCYFKI